MKIQGAKKVHYDSGPNMTPLVDVVMVILIFLMLAGSFGGAEHYLVSNLPIKQTGPGGQPPPPGFVPDEPLDIRVDNNRTADGYVARTTTGNIVAADADTLSTRLARLRDELERAGKTKDKIQVVISPGKSVKYKYLVEVYEAALEAQFTKVAFATAH